MASGSSTMLSTSPARVRVKTRFAIPRGLTTNQLEGAGTRSVMRAEERQQARGIGEGEQSQVDHDLFRRGARTT